MSGPARRTLAIVAASRGSSDTCASKVQYMWPVDGAASQSAMPRSMTRNEPDHSDLACRAETRTFASPA